MLTRLHSIRLRRGLGSSLLVILLGRALLNTVYRAPLSFLPIVTRDLGISLGAGGALITLRNLSGFSAPFLGPLSDRFGRVPLMAAGLGLGALAALLIGSTYLVPILALGMIALTVAKSIYDPAVHAYIGDRVPYLQRGRVLALTELAWSGAGLLGLPLVGLLAQFYGWRSPFLLAGVIILASVLLTVRGVEPAPLAAHLEAGHTLLPARIRALAQHPGALAALSCSFLMDVANENVNVVYAAWLNDRFSLDPLGLGLIASVIGLAELAGELASSGLVDRIGKKRTVTAGLVLLAAMTAALPLVGLSIWTAAAGLFVMYLLFEFSLVSSFPLLTELVPNARGAFISINVAALLLGRSMGSLTGPPIYTRAGFEWTGVTAAVVTLATALVWQTCVRERTG